VGVPFRVEARPGHTVNIYIVHAGGDDITCRRARTTSIPCARGVFVVKVPVSSLERLLSFVHIAALHRLQHLPHIHSYLRISSMLSLSPPSFPFVHLMVAQRSVDRELAERARRENKEAACMLLTADVRLVAQWVWQRIHAQT
jgi:hypothetical protein